MIKSSKIIFFGNERLSSGFEPHNAPTLTALVKVGYKVVAVVANNQIAESRRPRPLEIETVAKSYGIPVLLPARPIDIIDQLKKYQAVVGVLVAYGKIIPESVINIFPRGIINIHPSLLPHYRGPTPIEQAILDGVSETGVSLMSLVKAMDAGPLYAQAKIRLTGHETKADLTEQLLLNGSQMLIDNLSSIIDGTLKPTPQNEAKATFSKLLTKADGVIDISKPAEQLEREVRAFMTWPKSRLEIFGQTIIVTQARVAQNSSDGPLNVACADDTYLEITKLIAPSGRTMSGADFVRGYNKN